MRRAAIVALVVLSLGVPGVLTAGAASTPLPEDATLTFPGHGWGHGRGMGQYGAKGMAQNGSTYRSILSHYYSGVTFGARSTTEDIRVLVREASTIMITADTPFTIAFSNGTAVGTSDATYKYWRARWDGSAYRVERATSYRGPWIAVATSTSYVWFHPGSSMLQVVATDGSSHYYRGTIFARATPTTIRAVNVLTMQQYLYGVVPRESPASWPAEELKAQAVAARSYAAYKKDSQRARGYYYDICTTTMCQSYGGYAWKTSPTATKTILEYASSNSAVDATAGVTLLYGGKAILAEYSSSTGGYSDSGSVPYLRAVPDPADSVSPFHNWTGNVRVAEVEARWPALGRLVDLTVTQRNGYGDWGGRVLQMNLVGTSSTVTVSGGTFASAFSSDGLRGDWFTPRYYRGQLASTVSAISIPQGSVQTVAVRIKNTGTASWPVGGVVRLAAASARFHGSDWISTTRAATVARNVTSPSTTSVGPGQVAEFRIPIHTDGVAPGTYSERFTAVADGVSTMVPSFTMSVQVLPGWVDRGPNLIADPSFESNAWGWHGTGLTAGDGPTTTVAREGLKSYALTGGGSKDLTQTIPLSGGVRRFTLAGWNRASGSSSSGGPIGLVATARYTDGTSNAWSLEFSRAAHLWAYAETSFRTNASKSLASISISARSVSQTGTAYFDAIRLQETPTANGSFERGLTGWTASGFGSADGPVLDAADGNRALRIAGTPASKSVRQGLQLSGAAGERFTLGAWTRAAGTNPSGGPITATLTFSNRDGTSTSLSLGFPRAAHAWSYTEVEVRAPKSFSSALLRLGVTNQTGTVAFDAVRVTPSWVHNASFEVGTTGWSGYGWTTGDGATAATASEAASSLVLTGSGRVGAVQSIPFGGRAGHRFLVSGWVRTSGTSTSGGSIAYLAVLRNADGTTTGFWVPVAKGTHPWVYVEKAIVAPKAFTRLDIYAIFYDQPGRAYFDGVRVRNA